MNNANRRVQGKLHTLEQMTAIHRFTGEWGGQETTRESGRSHMVTTQNVSATRPEQVSLHLCRLIGVAFRSLFSLHSVFLMFALSRDSLVRCSPSAVLVTSSSPSLKSMNVLQYRVESESLTYVSVWYNRKNRVPNANVLLTDDNPARNKNSLK